MVTTKVSPKPRDRILDAATRLFYQKGIEVVGVNPVIDEADVAPMTLYRQFVSKDRLVAAALEQWSANWLHMLNDRIDRAGDDPRRRFDALWEALEDWFASDGFRGSFVTNAAIELRSKPDHPAHKVILAHRMAVHHLLEDLAKLAGAADPENLATQLQVLVDGAITVAAADRRPGVAAEVRALATTALAAAAR
ncbi:MAG TPA: TetR/AcrR family transcriptional regulator [Actinomycetota bacterium]|nr:TetR/AcrR family transcriptional regulator [Actinomycetota bacterium]